MKPLVVQHVVDLCESYRSLLGTELFEACAKLEGEELVERIFEAPVCIVSHGLGADPQFNYANRCALTLFEMTWKRFQGMPSRLSAETSEQSERADFMRRVSECGYVDDYTGIRVSATGQRFRINRATVWNVADATGRNTGQAAMFSSWTPLERRVCP